MYKSGIMHMHVLAKIVAHLQSATGGSVYTFRIQAVYTHTHTDLS